MKKKFVFEKDMIEPIIAGISTFTDSADNWFPFLECVCSFGIPDVVFAAFNQQIINRRMSRGLLPLVDAVKIKTLYATSNNIPRKTGEIAKLAGYSHGYVRSHGLKYLLEHGYVIETEDGYLRSPHYELVVTKIVAIEAKREDWSRGLYQASRYLRFSNRVFLALDKANSSRILPHIEHGHSLNVGLSLISASDYSVDICIKPDWHSPYSEAEYALVGERLWSVLYGLNNANFGVLYRN